MMEAEGGNENLNEERQGNMNRYAIMAVFVAVVIEKNKLSTIEELDSLNRTLIECKKNLAERDNEIALNQKEYERSLAEKESRIEIYVAQLSRQDKFLNMLDDCIKRMSAVNETEVKLQMGKLQGRLEEKEKTAAANVFSCAETIKEKEKKIDVLLKDVTSLTKDFERCQSQKENMYEKHMDCENKLRKTWF
uniref:Uncharacterized protein n=1 Tax=Amphimedon queenslandica TaxID=400682 RepID=A0A1X7VHF8_AMPQE